MKKQMIIKAGLSMAALALLASGSVQAAPELKIPLVGSAPRAQVAGQHLGLTSAEEALSVTVYVRRNNAEEFKNLVAAIESGNPLAHTISVEELSARYGANANDLASIEAFAAEKGMTVENVNMGARSITLSGTAAQMQEAFAVELHNFALDNGRIYHTHQGEVSIPFALAGIVESVVGLNNQPHFRSHMRTLKAGTHAASLSPFNPNQVAAIYNFPKNSAAGQCVAIVELGGGYQDTDTATYFKGLGITAPSVTAVGVDGATNVPGADPQGADGEVELDIQVAGAVAPGVSEKVYFGPNSNQGFVDAINQAAQSKCGAMSISWGGPEDSWDATSFQQMDQAFQNAVAAGVTVTAASGDSGSFDDPNQATKPVADFPGSSPHVLSCGGTSLAANGTSIASEVVWNELTNQEGAGGGGISTQFALPAWQKGLTYTTLTAGPTALSKRGVPDISGNADPVSGYNVLIDGQAAQVGGTSAVAPLYAGLFAIINAKAGKTVGFANATLYSHASAFHNITSGNNGTYKATKGWSAATGLGSPNGASIEALF